MLFSNMDIKYFRNWMIPKPKIIVAGGWTAEAGKLSVGQISLQTCLYLYMSLSGTFPVFWLTEMFQN